MGAKEYLSQALLLDKIINSKLEQKEVLESMAQKVTVDLTQERVCGGNSTKSPMENVIVKLIDLQHEINADIDRLIDLKREIMITINQVSDLNNQLILEMRYINGKGWEDVARDMGYDKRWILRLHGRALKEIEQKMKQATKSH